MSEHSENEIVVVACGVIQQKGSVTTTELISELENLMNPTGNDTVILDDRNDSKFSQKVRNIVSHRNPKIYNNSNIDVSIKNGITTFTWIGL
ncbi:hypothetical protein ACFBZI_10345 [Moraxella sp. ZJ142]|uniref:hypothetical protein n=1 Tax=Moraxella marmotae TaxID=3344520 RepID=UPI0035D447A2